MTNECSFHDGALRRMLSGSLLLVLAACAVGPDYTPPEADIGTGFTNAGDDRFRPAAPEETWWRTLGDATLSALIEQALIENHDLRMARANVTAARAFLREDRLDRFPVVTAGGSVSRQRNSAAAQVPSGTETYYDAGLDAVWELDFFGRVRRSVEAAGADYEASVADQRDIAVIVAAEVARTYVELRGAQYRLEVAIRNAVNQEQTLELTRLLLDAGRGTELDVSRAEAQLETTRANIAPLEAAVARATHRLGVLVGQRPTALSDRLATTAPLPELPAAVAVGDPAGLLRRRADIRAAERRLAAATARVGIATADLFPRVSLVGSAGYLSTDASSFGDGNSERSSIGPFLSWPAFDLGRVRARIDATDANVDGRLAAYEQTVLRALEETENSLVGYTRSHRREARLEAAAAASENAVALARTRYHNGVDSFLNVLDAERRLFEAQNLLAEAETDTALAFIALYKALGGAWSLS